jgi:hypothetical protein
VKANAAGRACPQVQSVLAKLSLCRTAALGGKAYQCDSCGDLTQRYHSCGERHCPQCSGRKRFDFADRASKLLLPKMTYYQVVFTLPCRLSQMALANRTSMAELLFQSAWKSLRKTIRKQQGYSPAAMMVLHTWNQKLLPHWHVHALVPGAGPSHAATRWQQATAPEGSPNSDGFYLVDAIDLRESFRRHAIAHLKRLRKQGKLKLQGSFAYLEDESAWKDFCNKLSSMDWVSYIQPPPTKTTSADQIIRYLTRYLTGGPISDNRIVASDKDRVTFMAREGKQTGGNPCQVPVTIPTSEFIGRWCDHIQPRQLTKTRYFGGWSNQNRESYLKACRRLLGIEPPSPVVVSEQPSQPLHCPNCEKPTLKHLGETPKPSWRELLSRRDERCPAWYVGLTKASLNPHLATECCIDDSSSGPETILESAMSPPVLQPPPARANRQLYLPNMRDVIHAAASNVLESG